MTTSDSKKRRFQDLKDYQNLNIKWEDAVCSICLNSPHNGVLLHCSSFSKGCRPFMCDTDHSLSNCLDRFKIANGLLVSSLSSKEECGDKIHKITSNSESYPPCPLCRGIVNGWVVVEEARSFLNLKKRCCEEKECLYFGNYSELQVHAKKNHPGSNPSEVDPARKLDWENFQQSSEIADLVSMLHAEAPDYVIDHGNDSGDEYDDFPRDEGNWWTSYMLYNVSDNSGASRIRRTSNTSELRTRIRLALGASESQSNESDEEITVSTGSRHRLRRSISDRALESVGSSHHRSYRRQRSRFP